MTFGGLALDYLLARPPAEWKISAFMRFFPKTPVFGQPPQIIDGYWRLLAFSDICALLAEGFGPLCCAICALCPPPPPLSFPTPCHSRGGGGRHLVNPKFFVAAHCVAVWVAPTMKAKAPSKGAAQSIPVESGEHVQEFKVKWSRTKAT